MATTTNQGWTLPTVGASEDAWGDDLNANWTALDTLLGGTNATEFAILDGATLTTAELNKLAGLATTAAELGYVNGVTSAIQTQIDAKQPLDATLTALAALATGASKIPYSTGTDTFGQLDFKDEDTMSSDSATAVPSQQSVKAYVDAAIAAIAVPGVGQTRTDVSGSRTIGVSYQNTTGKPIFVNILTTGLGYFETSANGSTWTRLAQTGGNYDRQAASLVMNNEYYRMNGGTSSIYWVELR